jgi:CheY-like chemotaxis protein
MISGAIPLTSTVLSMQNPPAGRPMEILLVEDNLVDARFAITALEKGQISHRLTLTRDGQEALEFLKREGRFARAPRPDLVLLDLRLPRVDGLQVLDWIKHDFPGNLPVVVMTSSEDEGDLCEAQSLGAEHYITKPVNLEKFLSIVKRFKHAWHPDVILPASV